MLTETILSLLGGGLGGALRFVPEVLKIFTAGKDREHEYRMTLLQLDIDKARSAQGIDLVHAQGEGAQALAELQAYTEAIRSQGQLTGVGWVDAVNSTVRPFCTYWWMILFSGYKLASLVVAWRQAVDFAAFVPSLWTTNDAGMLSMMIGFWFVDRSIRKR